MPAGFRAEPFGIVQEVARKSGSGYSASAERVLDLTVRERFARAITLVPNHRIGVGFPHDLIDRFAGIAPAQDQTATAVAKRAVECGDRMV